MAGILDPAIAKDLQNPKGDLTSLFAPGGALAEPGLGAAQSKATPKLTPPGWMNPEVMNQLSKAEKSPRLFAYLMEEKQTKPAPPLAPPEPTGAAKATKLKTFNPKDKNNIAGLLSGKLGTSKNSALDGLVAASKPAPTLPPGAATQKQDEHPVFTFLVNPQSLQWKRAANYTQAVTAATSVQSQQYHYTNGRSLQIEGLLMETFRMGRSLRLVLEQLQALLVPDVAKQSLAPKVLSFVWGSQIFKPCVLTNISWTEKSWLNGEPATVLLSIELMEIPPPDGDPVTRWVAAQKKRTQTEGVAQKPGSKDASKKLKTDLTDRQSTEGAKKADAWLKANQKTLSPTVQDRLKSGQYKLQPDPKTGDVFLTNATGQQKLGKIGNWDGAILDTDKNTIPKAAKPPKKKKKFG